MSLFAEFALKKNSDEIVHISEVDRGLKCDCYCAACGEDLIARKGNIKIYHFAHFSAECKYGRETALHLAAKKLIEKEQKIWLPASIVRCKNGKISIPRGLACVDSVKIEKKIGEIIPDVIVTLGGETILVEIFVTHGVDKIKTNKIQNMELSCVEFDLSSCSESAVTINLLNSRLIKGTGRVRWVNDVWAEEVEDNLHAYSEELQANDNFQVFPSYCCRKGFAFGSTIDYCLCYKCSHCIEVDLFSNDSKHATIHCIARIGSMNYENLNKKLSHF